MFGAVRDVNVTIELPQVLIGHYPAVYKACTNQIYTSVKRTHIADVLCDARFTRQRVVRYMYAVCPPSSLSP